MYRIDDRTSAIREIQRYLYEIHKAGLVSISRVPIDGIYGEQTRNAVSEFQDTQGIERSGSVGYETYTAIYREYRQAQALAGNKEYLISDNPFPFKRGDNSTDIEVIHLIFRELRNYYPDLPFVKRSSYFSGETESVARAAEAIFGMNESGTVTKALYDRMLRELSARKLMVI